MAYRHADRVKPVERRRHRGLQPDSDPAGDVARRPPRHVQEPGHGLLAGDRHRPRALRLEGQPAANRIEQTLDRVYGNAFMTRNYPKMRFTSQAVGQA